MDSFMDPVTAFPSNRGHHANVAWRAVSMEHLRGHPLYRSLPVSIDHLPSSVTNLCQYRQDSQQWRALHNGRLTTSKIASVVGFFEQDVAEYLSIPRSLRGHHRAVEGWQQLRANPVEVDSVVDTDTLLRTNSSAHRDVWMQTNVAPFPYAYIPEGGPPMGPTGYTDAGLTRLGWGSAQEATAVLCALNYLSATTPSLQLSEAGMQVFEALGPSGSPLDQKLRQWQAVGELPLLGASPDGLVLGADGVAVGVLEVKCSSPFVSAHSAGPPLFAQTSPQPHEASGGLPVWHIPQLQLEMLCAGPQCSSALVVLLSCGSARILQLPRDDVYQEELLRWARDVHTRFVKGVPRNRMKPPPPHFLSLRSVLAGETAPASPSFVEFLRHTQRLAASAQTVAVLSAEQIQRHPQQSGFFLQ